MGSSGELLARAISSLFQHASSPADKKGANDWINEFSKTDEAWQATLAVVSAESSYPVEVQFFCANMLLAKVRSGWSRLSEPQQGELLGLLRGKLRELQAGPGGPMSAVAERVGMVFAAAAVRSKVSMGAVAAEALQLLSSNTKQGDRLAFGVLAAIPEEVEACGPSRRQQLAEELFRSALPDVLGTLQILAASQPDRVDPGPCSKLVHGWLALDPKGGGCALPLGAFVRQFGMLFQFLVFAVPRSAEGCEAVCLLVEQTPTPNPQLVRQVLGSVLQSRQALLSEPWGLATLARVGGAAMHAQSPEVGKAPHGAQTEEFVALCELLCDCLSMEGLEVSQAESVMEFFVELNTVAMEDRHPRLRREIWERLLPQAVSCGAHAEDSDPSEVQRFRQGVLGEALENTYHVLKTDYLRFVSSLLGRQLEAASRGQGDWRAVEASLASLQAVGTLVKASLALRTAGADPAGLVQANLVNEVLCYVIGRVIARGSHDTFLSEPALSDTASRLVGTYAFWLDGNHQGCTPPEVMGFLVAVLSTPGASAAAAKAIAQVCSSCSRHLKPPGIASEVLKAVGGILLADPGPTGEAKVCLVEGVSRLISAMQTEQATQCTGALLAPLAASIEAKLACVMGAQAGSPGGAVPVVSLEGDLEVVASAFRFLEFGPTRLRRSGGATTPHPAAGALQQLMPTLARVVEQEPLREAESSMRALCALFVNALLSCKRASAPLLQPTLELTLALFRHKPHYGFCLEVPAAALESLSGVGEDAALAEAALSSFQLAFGFLAAQPDAGQHADYLEQVFDLASRCLLFLPAAVLLAPPAGGPDVLAALLQLASSTLRLKEVDAVRSANAFVSKLLRLCSSPPSGTPAWVESRPHVEQQVAAQGEPLLVGALSALAESAPPHLLRPLASTVYHLRSLAGPLFGQWVGKVAGSGEFAAYVAGLNPQVKEQDLRAFVVAAVKSPPLTKPLFEALLSDFGRVCRGEMTSDCLGMY